MSKFVYEKGELLIERPRVGIGIAATVVAGPVILRLDEDTGRWRSSDGDLARGVNAAMDPNGTSGADPYPARTAAEAAAKLVKGSVTWVRKQAPYVPGRIY